MQTAHEVETLDTLKNLVKAIKELDLDSDTRRQVDVEFDSDAHDLIKQVGDSLHSIAKSLEKMANNKT